MLVFEIWNWKAVVNPEARGCWSANHAEPCWFKLAVVTLRWPLLVTCGFDGKPLVKTWHAGGGVAELAHTLVVVKPPAGKLNDCADAGRTEKGITSNAANPSTANQAQVRIVILRFC